MSDFDDLFGPPKPASKSTAPSLPSGGLDEFDDFAANRVRSPSNNFNNKAVNKSAPTDWDPFAGEATSSSKSPKTSKSKKKAKKEESEGDYPFFHV